MYEKNKEVKVNHTENHPYPKWRVIAQYLLLGGIIGTIGMFLVLLTFLIFTGQIHELEGDWLEMFGILMFVMMIGFFLGLIPCFIAALIITKLEIYFDSIMKIVPLSIIGFFSGFVCTCYLIITKGFLGALGVMSFYGFIGSFSAVITGWFVLPKSK